MVNKCPLVRPNVEISIVCRFVKVNCESVMTRQIYIELQSISLMSDRGENVAKATGLLQINCHKSV